MKGDSEGSLNQNPSSGFGEGEAGKQSSPSVQRFSQKLQEATGRGEEYNIIIRAPTY